ATGGELGVYTFTLVSAAPAGLTLTSDGLLSGTPLVSGTFSFTIQAKDALSATTTKLFNLTTGPGPQNSALQLSALQLSFVAPQGGLSPPAQSLTVQTLTPQTFSILTDGGTANTPPPSWL